MKPPIVEYPSRKPFQGVGNIIRFNWPFYLIAGAGLIGGLWLASRLGGVWLLVGGIVAIGVVITIMVSLLVSWFVYDRSDLYSLDWVGELGPVRTIVNINAGFDETSDTLARKFPEAELRVFDFYDPKRHTEASIKRARRAYPLHPNTETITTDAVPLADESVDVIFLIFAAHEICQPEERFRFFGHLHRALRPGGKLIVVEHLRDWRNFLAYSIGFLHFMSYGDWLRTFNTAAFRAIDKEALNSFIVKFTLTRNEDSP